MEGSGVCVCVCVYMLLCVPVCGVLGGRNFLRAGVGVRVPEKAEQVSTEPAWPG